MRSGLGFYLVIFFIVLFPYKANASDFPAKEVYEAVSPSVVVIRSSNESGEGAVIGAGSVISGGGLIVTNAHVVMDRSTGNPLPRINVYLKPERLTGASGRDLSIRLDAEVLHFSKDFDLALLRAKGFPSSIKAVEFADPSEIKVGEEVAAIGHPEQGGFWSLTYGRVSGELQDYQGISGKDMYQTDTSVNRGNSGGPLLDRRGYVIAINSNIARVGRDGIPITGVNFSIKSSVVRKWLEDKGYAVGYGKRALVEDKKAARIEDKGAEKKYRETELLTPKRPYDYDEFLKSAEKDLEEMMNEMKGSTKR